MEAVFNGANLRLARLFRGLSLDDLAVFVGKSRQYVHKLETNQGEPTPALANDLAKVLKTSASFFYRPSRGQLTDERVHFRKLFTTRSVIKQVAMAKAEIFGLLVSYLDQHLDLPAVSIPTFPDATTAEDIERAAEACRRHWGLGLGPIDNVVRVAERAGALVTSFDAVSAEVDALSVVLQRPIIVRNEAKESVSRQRFDICHELGHFVLHAGLQTGDRVTESQANRFASAFLMPRSMMVAHWPKPKGSRLDWVGMRQFKLTWKVSKAAMLYRARQLDLIDDAQYKTGVITLRRTGEAAGEKEDRHMPLEMPSLVRQAVSALLTKARKSADEIAYDLGWTLEMLEELVGKLEGADGGSLAKIIQLDRYRTSIPC